ncbi:MAG: hypothetical protein Q4F21_14765 [Lachnospiraceae bacterium]|nr:hypothetical protein [Lachnospiraceae bacterium]
MGYFEDALQNFVQDFQYGGAIRHLVDRGYTADRIIRSGEIRLPREKIEKIVEQYLLEKEKKEKKATDE